MNIILIRHGEAESSSLHSKDSDRQLTPEGQLRTQKNAQMIKNYVPSVDIIVSSPLLRAQQTAGILAEVFKYKKQIIVDKKLSSGSRSEDILDLANYLDGKNIVFVGHQPDLGYHVSYLISASGAQVEFKKSAAAKISFSKKAYAGKGVLEFLIPPMPEK